MTKVIFGNVKAAVKALISNEPIPEDAKIKELSDDDIVKLRFDFIKNSPLVVVAEINGEEYQAFYEDVPPGGID